MNEQAVKQSQPLYPGERWFQYVAPEEAGYSSQQLAKARNYFDQLGAGALFVVHDGAVLLACGAVTRRFMCHSIRKSYMSALYGIQADKIDLNKSLAELKIDDEPPLTETEKQARIIDLLRSRSGVYHTAAYEAPYWADNKPARDSHLPGSHWYYNNWDFNTLLTIFEQETGSRFFETFKQTLADPLQMEAFRLSDTYHHYEPDKSIHPAYPFRMSVKDMARFGLLYLRRGRWQERQIVPESWVEESTTCYSRCDEPFGYGYLWWTAGAQFDDGRWQQLGLYEALGTQRITIIPAAKLVVVFCINTYQDTSYERDQYFTLLEMILSARTSPPPATPHLVPFQDPPHRTEPIQLDVKILDQYVGDYEFEDGWRNCIRREDQRLVATTIPAFVSPTYLVPVSETTFILEDIEASLIFTPDHADYQLAVEVVPGKIVYGKVIQ